jgi:hypothetical protein
LSRAPPDARLLALRPVGAVQHLRPGSQACPLSPRGLLGRGAGRRGPLPIFRAAYPALLRAALVAAREVGSIVGLALPPELEPEPWFGALAAAADDLAPGLPLVLVGEVRAGAGAAGAERAVRDAHRLVEAGLTHLCLDLSGQPMAERARVAADAAAFAADRELGVECVVPGGPAPSPGTEDALAFLEELRGWGLEPDALSVRCAPAPSAAAAAAQAQALASLVAALAPLPLFRRGPLSDALLPRLADLGLAAVDDGDRMAAAAGRALSDDERIALEGSFARGGAPPALEAAVAERLEALAFAEAASVLEGLGTAGSASAGAEALVRAG